ncbi:MAG TPA: hypothetical protein VFR19_24910 [Hyphomicrobiaceae bacterium]|jgi:hypothetical protein|nr:hypothetical protein [Hyphomicrobiaceae bacterium]
MFKRFASSWLLALAALLTASFLFGWPASQAQAQQSVRIRPGTLNVIPGPGPGGYSMTLSDIWGLPEMPPAPKDFGPHFDFPAGGSISLQGPPDHSPYPN